MFQPRNHANLYRTLLVLAGTVYGIWWFIIYLLIPNDFNPIVSRLFLVLFFFGIILSSYFYAWVEHHFSYLWEFCLYVLTAHYFYVFYGNGHSINWILGSYIIIIAGSFILLSPLTLTLYSTFVIGISCMMVVHIPSLRSTVFLPGILTILLQMNIGLRSRLAVIQKLSESNSQFQLLFNATFDGIVVHHHGLILEANHSLLKALELEPHEFIGKYLVNFIHPNNQSQVKQQLELNSLIPFEAKMVKKNNELIDYEFFSQSFVHQSKNLSLVTLQNITDRKKVEAEKVRALTLAENIRVRDEFISIASHELKTPLTSLKLQGQILQSDLSGHTFDEHQIQRFKTAMLIFNRQIDRLGELVEAMLDVSLITVGRLTLSIQDTDLVTITREILTSVLFQVGTNLQNCTITLDAPATLTLQADPARLKQVIENLLMNAIKYGEGKPIQVTLKRLENTAILQIKDHGMGIHPESSSRIFDRYERAISARKLTGLGLGLYISRNIIEAHHGQISFQSKVGQGSIFSITLPI